MRVPRSAIAIGLGLALLYTPKAVLAQQSAKVYRIGILSTGGPEQENFVWADLRGQLRDRGWVEGKNLVLE